VARTFASCTDTSVLGVPFTVVGYVPGITFQTQDQLAQVTDDQITAMHTELIRVLTELHAGALRAGRAGRLRPPEWLLPRQVKRWRQQWDYVQTSEQPDVDRLYQSAGRPDAARADADDRAR